MAQPATKKDIPVLFANGEQSIMKRNKNVLAKFSPFKKKTQLLLQNKKSSSLIWFIVLIINKYQYQKVVASCD